MLLHYHLKDFIIKETEDWLALNKPSGFLSIPDREGKEVSLKSLLKDKYGNIFTVHRIDKDTSGLILFAKNETAHKHLTKQFEERKTKKIYCGLVIGSPGEKNGTITQPIAEHPALNGTMMVIASFPLRCTIIVPFNAGCSAMGCVMVPFFSPGEPITKPQ